MTKMIDKNGVVLRAGDLFEYQLRGTVATGCVDIRDGEPWVTWIISPGFGDMPVEKWWYGPHDSRKTKFLRRGK
jgi:hypothetical protein